LNIGFGDQAALIAKLTKFSRQFCDRFHQHGGVPLTGDADVRSLRGRRRARQTCCRVTPRSPCRHGFNPAFTMSVDSVNRNGFSAMVSMFR